MNMARVSGANLPMEMTFWDLGGAFGLRGIWENYFADADACAYVVDGSDEDALEEAMVELERALRNKKFSKRMPVLILSSKIDLSGPEGVEMVRASCEDVFARVDASQSARSWSVFSIDANRGLGVKPAIEWLTSVLAPTNSFYFSAPV
jgi:signal recognition particle receptor subunit beta